MCTSKNVQHHETMSELIINQNSTALFQSPLKYVTGGYFPQNTSFIYDYSLLNYIICHWQEQ